MNNIYKPTIQWWLEHRNKTTNKIITVGELNGEILYGIDSNIKFAYIRNNKENVESVYNILSQDKDFKNDNFVDVLTDEEIKEYME